MEHLLTLTAVPNPVRRISRDALRHAALPQLLAQEIRLTLRLDGRTFFEDEYFCILEFLRDVEGWLASDHRVAYEFRSVESEAGPLLAFLPVDGGFLLRSCWQAFDASQTVIRKDALIDAVTGLLARWVEPS